MAGVEADGQIGVVGESGLTGDVGDRMVVIRDDVAIIVRLPIHQQVMLTASAVGILARRTGADGRNPVGNRCNGVASRRPIGSVTRQHPANEREREDDTTSMRQLAGDDGHRQITHR